MTLQRLLYSTLLILAMPIIVLRLLWRSRKNASYRQGIKSRFAYYSQAERQGFSEVKIWVHAVSVGETLAAKPLIAALIAHYGDNTVLVTSTTPTGFDTVRRLFTNKVQQHYFPNDLPWLVSHALDCVNPQLFIAIETEIWPNFWHACNKKNIPLLLANARLSTRSTQRYQKILKLVSSTLQQAQLIACRASTDANNFIQLGANKSTVRVIGDIKWDMKNSDKLAQQGKAFRQHWGDERLVIVAASTHEGEDKQILSLFNQLYNNFPTLLLIIVPRHPERFDQVADLIENKQLSLQRRSEQQNFLPTTQVVLGDSMGEMQAWFAAADLVIMGGSLVNVGGHNPMEASAYGVPVISGSAIHNFTEAFDILTQQGVAFVCDDEAALRQQALSLLSQPLLRKKINKIALEIVAQNKGATNRLMEYIKAKVN